MAVLKGRITLFVALLSSFVFFSYFQGCTPDSERLPEMISDPKDRFSAKPRDAAEAAEWKRVLDPRNSQNLVRSARVKYFTGNDKQTTAVQTAVVDQALRIVATVELGPGIQSVPLEGRIRIDQRLPTGQWRWREHSSLAKPLSSDFKTGVLVFENRWNPSSAGSYRIHFRFHSFELPPQPLEVTARPK